MSLTLKQAFRVVGLTGLLWVFLMPAHARPLPDGLSDLVQRLSPSVVNIGVVRPRGADGQDSRVQGSGFVVDSSGLVVTNNHVVEGAREIYVGFSDGSRRVARLEGSDPKSDLALLRIAADKQLVALVLGDSDAAQAGEWVLAIGNPFGLGGSVSAGIISARNRQLDTDAYDDFIQTDVAINRGSSGGPLFDLDGNVVGVNSSLISPNGGSAGVSFAIPSNTVKFVLAQLRRSGRVRRGWIGANVQDLTPDLAAAFSQTSVGGALVGNVTPSGPAAVAGIIPGDIITKIDGKVVPDSRSMQKAVAEADIGRVLVVSMIRKGATQQISVRVSGKANGSEQNVATHAAGDGRFEQLLGLSTQPLSPQTRSRQGLGTSVNALLVLDIAAGSPGAEADVRPDDVITQIDQKPVSSVAQLRAFISKARSESRRAVLVTMLRGGEMMFKALRLGNRKVDTALASSKAVAPR
ncbi:MAG: trypsin-like peptidase domain-containing protein [Micropepsaceae bacterium]